MNDFIIDHRETLYRAGKLLKSEGKSIDEADHHLFHWDILFMVPFNEEEIAKFWEGYNETL